MPEASICLLPPETRPWPSQEFRGPSISEGLNFGWYCFLFSKGVWYLGLSEVLDLTLHRSCFLNGIRFGFRDWIPIRVCSAALTKESIYLQ